MVRQRSTNEGVCGCADVEAIRAMHSLRLPKAPRCLCLLSTGTCGPQAMAARRPPTAALFVWFEQYDQRCLWCSAGAGLLVLAGHRGRLRTRRWRQQLQCCERRLRPLRHLLEPARLFVTISMRRTLSGGRRVWLARCDDGSLRDCRRRRSSARQLQSRMPIPGRLELGHRFLTPWFGGLGVSPLRGARSRRSSFRLTGAIIGAMRVRRSTTVRTPQPRHVPSSVAFTDKSYALDGAVLALRGRAAWAHDFNPDRAIGRIPDVAGCIVRGERCGGPRRTR